jgi:hypothetical protein
MIFLEEEREGDHLPDHAMGKDSQNFLFWGVCSVFISVVLCSKPRESALGSTYPSLLLPLQTQTLNTGSPFQALSLILHLEILMSCSLSGHWSPCLGLKPRQPVPEILICDSVTSSLLSPAIIISPVLAKGMGVQSSGTKTFVVIIQNNH